MSDVREVLSVLSEIDVAGLLSDCWNAIRHLAEAGHMNEAMEQLQQWQRAFGPNIGALAAAVRALPSSADQRAARLEFARLNEHRHKPLRRLMEVIAAGEGGGVSRWRWAAHAYRGAVERFVWDRMRHVELAKGAEWPRGEQRRDLQRHPLLAVRADVYEFMIADTKAPVAVRLHATERMAAIAAEVNRHVTIHTDAVQVRDHLREQLLKLGLDTALRAADRLATTLNQQISAYQNALEHAGRLEALRHSASASAALADALRQEVSVDLEVPTGVPPVVAKRLALPTVGSTFQAPPEAPMEYHVRFPAEPRQLRDVRHEQDQTFFCRICETTPVGEPVSYRGMPMCQRCAALLRGS